MIATARLHLRPAQASDLPALHAIYSDPRAMRHWSHPPHTSLEQTADLLARLIRSEAELGPEWVIALDGEPIGRAGLWRAWELGFILHPDRWGQGYGREAVAALLEAAFARHPACPAVTADIDPRNIGSARVLEACGFALTGTARNTYCINGEWSDSSYYRRIRP